MSNSAELLKGEILDEIGRQLPDNLVKDSKDRVHIIFQENDAEKIYEETPVSFSGVIKSPLEWLSKRISTIEQLASYVIINRESFKITLLTEERSHFKNKVIGSLVLDTTFKLFSINTETFRSNKDWAALFKKHKYAFDSLQKANDMILALLNFKAKIEQEYEQGKDNKGNVTNEYRRKVIENSLPSEFELRLPIFKGQQPIEIPVVFEVNDTDLSLSLWSDYAQLEIQKERDSAIDDVLKGIGEIAPNIVIFEE